MVVCLLWQLPNALRWRALQQCRVYLSPCRSAELSVQFAIQLRLLDATPHRDRPAVTASQPHCESAFKSTPHSHESISSPHNAHIFSSPHLTLSPVSISTALLYTSHCLQHSPDLPISRQLLSRRPPAAGCVSTVILTFVGSKGLSPSFTVALHSARCCHSLSSTVQFPTASILLSRKHHALLSHLIDHLISSRSLHSQPTTATTAALSSSLSHHSNSVRGSVSVHSPISFSSLRLRLPLHITRAAVRHPLHPV